MKDANVCNYSDPKARKWVYQMLAAGYAVKHYHGRNFYEGPSITCNPSEKDEIIRLCDIALQQDSMGKSDIVVYPTFKAIFQENGPDETAEEIAEWQVEEPDMEWDGQDEKNLRDAKELLKEWMELMPEDDEENFRLTEKTRVFLSK